MLGHVFDRLKNEISAKENKISEKDEALCELQRRHDELDAELKVAKDNAQQNQDVIKHLNESKDALLQKLMQGTAELQSMKKDKEAFKSTVEYIVKNDSRQRDSFVKKVIYIQTKNSALQQDLNQERQAKEKQKLEFEEKQHALQAQHRAQVAEMREEIRQLKERIHQLEGCLPGATALPTMVRTLNMSFLIWYHGLTRNTISYFPAPILNIVRCVKYISNNKWSVDQKQK